MIISKDNKMNQESFNKIFAKKFLNFCNKLPIFVSYTLTPDGIIVYEDEKREEELLNYKFDYSINVQKNIFQIKKILAHHFPVMTEVRVEEITEVTSDEINRLLNERKISMEDVTAKGYQRKYRRNWVIEKLIINRDELFIRDSKTFESRRYKLRYPVVTFIKKVLEHELSRASAWDFFIGRAELLKLDPKDEGVKNAN